MLFNDPLHENKGCSRPFSCKKFRGMNESQLISTQIADITNDLIVRIAIGVFIAVYRGMHIIIMYYAYGSSMQGILTCTGSDLIQYQSPSCRLHTHCVCVCVLQALSTRDSCIHAFRYCGSMKGTAYGIMHH